jgi:signal transduction histidine kinase
MRFLKHLLFTTTLLIYGYVNCYPESLFDPIDDQYIKLKIDSTLISDSIQRLHQVQHSLTRAFQYLNTDQLDSAIHNAEIATRFDVNLIPGEVLAQAFYILGKVNRINHKADIALKNYLLAIQKLRYSDEIGYRSEIYQELAIIYNANGWTSKAIERYIDAYQVESKQGNDYKQIELLNTIASLYIKSNDYKNAILYQEELLSLYSKHDLNKALILMEDIANNYVIIENYQKAIYLHSQILITRKKFQDIEGQLSAILDIVKIYKEQPDYKKLYAYIDGFNDIYKYQRKKELTPQIRFLKGECLLILGDLSALQGSLEIRDNFENALLYYDSAYNLFSSISANSKAAESKLAQANAYFKIKDYKSAIDNCELALTAYHEEGNFPKLIQCYRLISDAYMSLDRYKLAYQAQSRFLSYSDSLGEIQRNNMAVMLSQFEENANRTAFQNIEQTLLQEELDTLSDALLHLEIEKQTRDIELLVKEKSLKELALRNEQLKNEQVTNENTLLQQQIEADLREKEILNLQAERSRQETELRNQTIYQITNQQQIYALEQEKKLSDLQLQKADVQRVVYLLIVIISLMVLISVIIGYINLRRSRGKIKAKNIFIEEQNTKLKDLNEEKNRLIRIVAHDLKNPLTSALTLSEILYKNTMDSSIEDQQNISLIRRSLRRMQEMINKILDIKAIDSEKLNLEIEAVNIKLITDYLIEMFASKAGKKNIRIVNESEELFINVDRDYFIQILENLISNALKFSSRNTLIRIKTIEHKETCRISVSDQGPGFSKKEQKLLFIENKTLSPKPTFGESSNGLGLSIVKKYVEAMKGTVWCDSKLGEGSTFYIEFEKALEIA